MKDREDDEEQHAVEARADAAEDDFTEHEIEERDAAGQRRQAVVHRVDRAIRGVGRGGGPQHAVHHAEAHFLALEIGRERGDGGIVLRLGPPGSGEADDEEDHHRRENHPALAPVADHAPKV